MAERITIGGHPFVPLDFERRSTEELLERSQRLVAQMLRRRSVRAFSSDPVPRELIDAALTIASSAPSGAHMQPWRWVVVTDPDLRSRIRQAAEEEERDFYAERAPQEWLEALAPLGTDDVKSHLTDAPYLVVLFKRRYTVRPDGRRTKHYYATESCGIAAGFFIGAIHQLGLATLPHTPSPMGFLQSVLERPEEEQPYLVLPVGFPADDAVVPDLARRPLDELTVWT